MDKNKQLFELTKELQALAQAGIQFTTNPYDLERFERIREISASLLQLQSDIDMDQILKVFCDEKGYKTPKLDTRGIIIKDNKILLVEENDHQWCLPGGYVDQNETIASNTEKEVLEEAGYHVKANRIVALQDRDTHNANIYMYTIVRVFVICELIDGTFKENIETIDSNFFSMDELPILNEMKTTKQQIQLCFDAYYDSNFKVQFD